MLAYAADTPRAAGRATSPKALTLIIAGHAILITAVMTAKMELVTPPWEKPPILVNIKPDPVPPPEPETKPTTERLPQHPFIDQVAPIVPVEQLRPSFPVDQGPLIREIPPLGGSGGDGIIVDPPRHVPVRVAARLATGESALKPPYPTNKLRLGEEATLKLRLSIDNRGRVIAVEAVGAADPSFLAAARRHILRAWRYKPATEDGAAVPYSTIITLSFRLEDA